jgi:hypothetical protein
MPSVASTTLPPLDVPRAQQQAEAHREAGGDSLDESLDSPVPRIGGLSDSFGGMGGAGAGGGTASLGEDMYNSMEDGFETAKR